MRSKNNRIISIGMCLLGFLMLFSMHVSAASAVDTDKAVSLTIAYGHENTVISGAQFDLYYVADINIYAEFKLSGDFEKYPVEVNNLDSAAWKSLSETLAGYIERDKLIPLDSGKTDDRGILYFPAQQTKLRPGLYLVAGKQFCQGDYRYIPEPFLVSLPGINAGNNEWSYNVTVQPKYEREPYSLSGDRTVDRKVIKIWKNDKEEFRPEEIQVSLLKDGKIYDNIILNSSKNWQYTWKALPEYNADGSKIEWKVVEKEPGSYTVSVIQEGITFIVTNTYTSEDFPDNLDDLDDGDHKLPQTGVRWWPAPLLAGGGLILLIIDAVLKRRKHYE